MKNAPRFLVVLGLVALLVAACSSPKNSQPTAPGQNLTDDKKKDDSTVGGGDNNVTIPPSADDGAKPVALPKTLVSQIIFYPAQHRIFWKNTSGTSDTYRNVVRYKASSTMIALVREGDGMTSVMRSDFKEIFTITDLAFDSYGEPQLRVSNRFVAYQGRDGNGGVIDLNGKAVFTLTSDMELVQVSDSYIAYRLKSTGQWKVRSANGNELSQIPSNVTFIRVSDRFLGYVDKGGSGAFVDAYTNNQLRKGTDWVSIDLSSRLLAYRTRVGGVEIFKEDGTSLQVIQNGISKLEVSHEFAGALTQAGWALIYDRNGKIIQLPKDTYVDMKISDAFASVQNDKGTVYVFNKHGQKIAILSNVKSFQPLSSGFVYETGAGGPFELEARIDETYEPVKFKPISRQNPPVYTPPVQGPQGGGYYPPNNGPVLYPMPPNCGGCGGGCMGPPVPWMGGGCMPGPVYMPPMMPVLPPLPQLPQLPMMMPYGGGGTPCWNGWNQGMGGAGFGANLNFNFSFFAGFGASFGGNYGGGYGYGRRW